MMGLAGYGATFFSLDDGAFACATALPVTRKPLAAAIGPRNGRSTSYGAACGARFHDCAGPARATTISRLGMTTIRLSYRPHDQNASRGTSSSAPSALFQNKRP